MLTFDFNFAFKNRFLGVAEGDLSAFLFFWGYSKVMKLALTLKVKGAGTVIPLNGKTPACHNIKYYYI